MDRNNKIGLQCPLVSIYRTAVKKKKKIGLCELKLYLGYKSYHGGKLQFTLKHLGIFNMGQNCIHNDIFILRLHQKKELLWAGVNLCACAQQHN